MAIFRNNINNRHMENTIIERIKKIIEYKQLSSRAFAIAIDFNYTTLNNYLTGRRTSIDKDLLVKIISTYDDISSDWLLINRGSMLKPSTTQQYQLSDEFTEGAIPYYDNLPVSAGQFDLATYHQDEKPTGYIKIPGVSAKGLFPVIGCSMKPDINPGDVVGLSNIDRWEMVDPDKVYLIVTRDDRMIKHLMIDETDKEILWCISPNYPKFSIRKDEIIYIYRITFHGRLM